MDVKIEWMTVAQVCDHLCVSRGTLANWEKSGRLVPARVGGIVRYRRHEVDAVLGGGEAA